jgi:GntR family transcriptional regulator/MocR family aminotransferase
VLYAERQAALVEAARSELEGVLELNPSGSGLHLIGWLAGHLDDQRVTREAANQGADVWPLSLHSIHPYPRPALLLGYGALTEAEIHTGVKRLAGALQRQLCESAAKRAQIFPAGGKSAGQGLEIPTHPSAGGLGST